jgi:hypothetical protein
MSVHRIAVTATVLSWLEDASRDALTWIYNKVMAVTAVGWASVVIAVLLLIWAWAIMHVSTRVGSIAVDDLTADDAKGVPLIALTAVFRRRLWLAGLVPPPAVVYGSPQATLIQAVATITPQGATIAKLLEMLPTPPSPPEFRVTAVLTGNQPSVRARSARCGVDYTVQPLSRGASYLQSVGGCEKYEQALTDAAANIYQHIAQILPDVFPPWVRWRSEDALNDYISGLTWRTDGLLDVAAARLERAVTASPFNALAALQLANLDERRAGASADTWTEAYYRTRALARYRATAVLWPTVFEARYRASVVSAALASNYEVWRKEANGAALRAMVREMVPFGSPSEQGEQVAARDPYVRNLRDFADRESSAAVQLLHPMYMLVRHYRLRNQFEAKGTERKTLRTGARLSRHCIRLRRLNAESPPARDDEELFRSALVLRLTWNDLTWQSRYNLACFDALRLAGTLLEGKHRERILRRALRNLDRAIREAAGALSRGWVENDPDMEIFRHWPTADKTTLTPDGELSEWKEIVVRAPQAILGEGGTGAGPPPEAQVADVPANGWKRSVDHHPNVAPTTVAERPWGSTRLREVFWVIALVLFVAALGAVVFLAGSGSLGILATSLLAAGGVVAFGRSVRGVTVAERERRFANAATPASSQTGNTDAGDRNAA